jgi:hypothetical protein
MQDLRRTGNKVVTEREKGKGKGKSKREIKENVLGTKRNNRHMWKIDEHLYKGTEDLSKAVQAAIGRRTEYVKGPKVITSHTQRQRHKIGNI